MIHLLPLQLRSVSVTVPVLLDPCGPDCLLTSQEAFPFALPGGMAVETHAVDGALQGVLLATGRGTLIKSKSSREAPHGRTRHFSEESHRRALEMLRAGCSEDVCRPGRECGCSLEIQIMEGRIAWTPFSMHAARIAELSDVHQIRTSESALAFLGSAWRTLSALNRAGISHGDPAFYNFLVGNRAVLIDLDDCAYTGEAESPWDQSIFVHATVVPMLGEFMSAREIVSVVGSLMPDASIAGGDRAEALVTSTATSMEQNRANRLLRSLAMRSRALEIGLSETRTKLDERLAVEHRRYQDMAAAAGERLKALEAAHVEMAQLRSAADERGRLLQRVHDEASGLHRQLKRSAAITDEDRRAAALRTAELERRARKFEAAAGERLAALQEKEEALRQLRAELRSHRERQ